MAYKILTTVYSEQDLDSILGYMIRELHAPQAATDFADAVGACYDRLSEMPALGGGSLWLELLFSGLGGCVRRFLVRSITGRCAGGCGLPYLKKASLPALQ